MLYRKVVSPFLDRRDSETWHIRAREFLHWLERSRCGLKAIEFFADKHKRFVDDKLHVSLGGIEFENPVLIGAGWDKAGRAVRGLWQLGASGVEVGAVLEHSQPGNDKPRQWIVASGVCINALGFNAPDMGVVRYNLGRYEDDGIPIGINVGENKWLADIDSPEPHAAAYAAVVGGLYHRASWFTINISSPNTPRLRRLQGREYIGYIVKEVRRAMEAAGGRKFLLIKIAPDIDTATLDGVIEVALEYGLGIVATNTTSNPGIKARYGEKWRDRPGGLSGDDLYFRELSTSIISYIHRETKGEVPIMGAGGIKDGPTAMEKILAGASLLQIVTSLRGEGLRAPSKINRELAVLQHALGIGGDYSSIQDLVGESSIRGEFAALKAQDFRAML